MANLFKTCMLATCLLFVAGTADATTYFVRASGSDAYDGKLPSTAFATIKQAAQVAANGDVVYVGAGAYADSIVVLGVKQNSSTVRFVADVNGTATGDAGTVLVSGTTFRVAGSNGVQIEGFSFYGGSSHPVIWQDSYSGTIKDCVFAGGIKSLLMKNGSLTIENCQFTNFQNDAIQVDGTARLLVNGCTITGSARRGIDIRKTAYVAIDSSSITNCTGDGVHVEVTTDVISVDAITASNCECSGGTSPLDLKRQAYDILHAMHPADAGYRHLITAAAQDVHGMLHTQLWTDGWHLNIADGPAVYTTSSEVIEQLNSIYNDEVDFDIIGDELSVKHPFVAKVTVLGAAISYGSHYDAPVTVQIKIGTETYEPFGSFTSPTQGNVNDNNNPRVFEPSETFDESDTITVAGRSWLKNSLSLSGSQDSHWYTYLNVNATTFPDNLQVLRDGDPVPNLSGANGQSGVASFLTDYIDEDGLIELAANQAIVLFELGTTNMNSTAADFQDLVTLIGLRRSIAPLTDEELAQIKQAMDLLLESDRTLANCAINEGACGGGDTTILATATSHYQAAQGDSAGERYVEASLNYQQAWTSAKTATGDQDVDFTADLAARLAPAPPSDWVAVSDAELSVSGSTVTGNATGLWMETQQELDTRYTDYSSNTEWGLGLYGTSRVEHCTISSNGVGGLWLNQTDMADLTVSTLTLANNTQYGLYADASDVTLDSNNIGDWAISGSQIGVAAVGGDMTLQSVSISGGTTAAVQVTQGTLQATSATFSGSGYGLGIDDCSVTLASCTFSGNSVGLYANQNNLLSVTNSTFTGNSVWGASVTPSGAVGETATFTGCSFTSNVGGLTVIGAGDGDVLLRGATVISDNTAAGLHFQNCNLAVNDQAAGANWSTLRNQYGISGNQSTLALSNVSVRDCTSFGILCENSSVSLSGCTVIGSHGVYADAGNNSLTINASVFNSGSTAGFGVIRSGGNVNVTNTTLDGYWISVGLGSLSGTDQATVLNSTIANAAGYGVYVYSGDAVIRNTIMTGTGSGYGLVRLTGTTTHTHNLIYGFGAAFNGTTADATELLKTPRFVDAANGNFHLGVGSPAINAGLDVGSLVPTDMDGNSRPSYNGYEIGAYEYMSPNGSLRVLEWEETR